MSALKVLHRAAVTAMADMRTLYTWRTWTLGWLTRMAAQVTLFAFAGQMYGGDAGMAYVFVGATMMASTIEAMMTVASTVWEKLEGTLPLLFAAPGPLFLVFAGRSIQWLASGTLMSSLILALGPFFGVPVTPVAWLVCVPLVGLTSLATYALALTLGFVVLHYTGTRNIVSNVAYMYMLLVCGVVTPVSHVAGPLQVTAPLLPLTHGLAAVRSVLSDALPRTVLLDVTGLVLTGLAWTGLALLTLKGVVKLSREKGSAHRLL